MAVEGTARVRLSLNADGLAVVTRENGRTTDIVTLTESFSERVAAAVPQGREALGEWLAVILRCAELVPAELVESRCRRLETIH
jgi:hypothetical protein